MDYSGFQPRNDAEKKARRGPGFQSRNDQTTFGVEMNQTLRIFLLIIVALNFSSYALAEPARKAS